MVDNALYMEAQTVNVASVWPFPVHIGALEYGAHIGTSCLHNVCGYDALWWGVDEDPPARVTDYDVLIVNMFSHMQHVTQIKAVHPAALVVALPDAYFDDVFRQGNPRGLDFLKQLQAADVIGYVSESNRQFYGALLNKPMVYIPHPIGTPEFFEKARRQTKDNFLITLDHIEHAGQRPLDYTAQNVAAVAAIQRKTGIRVLYVNAGEETREYARLVGLQAEFCGYMVYAEYVRIAARARLGVDMYALHGFGRNELTLAYAGTPCIGSTYTHGGLKALKFDPWNTDSAVIEARRMICGASGMPTLSVLGYEAAAQLGVAYVEQHYSFDAARKQMADTLERLETWRLQPTR